MKHSDILSLIEREIKCGVIVTSVDNIKTIHVSTEGTQIKQGINTPVGLYGFATVSMLIPIDAPFDKISTIEYIGHEL